MTLDADSPVMPSADCRDGKHAPVCFGGGWDMSADAPCPCPCTCHRSDPVTLHLHDLLDVDQLDALIASGHIRHRTHPDDDRLRILNYTEKAQYERVWTHETRTCRGLIVDDAGAVLARPWAKFYNYGEHPEGALDLSARVEVTDKLDGSLGILYAAPDGWAIATRGSFASEQAQHATAVLRERYSDFTPIAGWTYLFEVIYPANRIVVDYTGLDDMVLLGAVRIADGMAAGPNDVPEWTGPRTRSFEVGNLADALAMPPRPNAEGVVVRFVDGLMVKVKQDDYVRLHRLVTGLSERSVWEHLAENAGTYTGLLESIPDEFHGWVQDTAETLKARHWDVLDHAIEAHNELLADLGDNPARKDYALAIRDRAPELAPYCFQMLDGRDPAPSIWKAIRPVGSNPMKHTSEDVA